MVSVYSSDSREQAKHLAIIQTLAGELGFPESKVGLLYEREFSKLSQHAKVKDFLPLLVIRRVKEDLTNPDGA